MRRVMMVPVLAAVAAPAVMAQQVKVGARGPDNVEQRKPLQVIVLSSGDLRALKLEIDELVQLNNRTERQWAVEYANARDPRRIQELQDNMAQVGFELISKQSRLAFACAELKRRTGPFTGWIGVTFERDVFFKKELGPASNKVWVSFEGVPRIAKVEPGSPAEVAGVQIGDEWMAVNGRAIVDSVEFSELDKPGATVSIRLRRIGQMLENHLVVGKNPPYPDDVCESSERIAFAPAPIMQSPRPGGAVPARVPQQVQVQAVPPGAAPRMQVVTMAYVAFGGATLRPLDDDDRETFKVRDGMLVSQVAPATPAAIAGLRKYDVVVSVNGETVSSVFDVRKQMWTNEKITLTVQRDGKTRDVVLVAK